VPRALAPQLEVAHQAVVEEHHGFRCQRAVLGGAEGEHVDAGAPGDVARVAVKERHRVGKARAVHLHRQAAPVRERAQRADVIGAVHGAHLGHLGERERRRLGAVHADVHGRVVGERALEGPGRDAPVLTWDERQLRAA
jgi:hypothetical protein